jgi:hypothetical protein
MIKLKHLLQEVIKVTNKDNDSMGVDILEPASWKKNKKTVGHFDLESYDDGKTWTISAAEIDPSYRGKGLYQSSILSLLDTLPNITIVSAFRSSEAERAWASLSKKLYSKYSFKVEKEDGEKVYYLSKK